MERNWPGRAEKKEDMRTFFFWDILHPWEMYTVGFDESEDDDDDEDDSYGLYIILKKCGLKKVW